MCKAIRILQRFLQTSGNNGVGTVFGVILSLLILMAPMAFATPLDSSESFVSPFGYVTDLAQLVEPEVERKICDIATELERKTGIRIAVISVPELYGYEIEEFTHEILNRWIENPIVRAHSVLIIDAPNDEKLRLEMGVALDTILTTETSRANPRGRCFCLRFARAIRVRHTADHHRISRRNRRSPECDSLSALRTGIPQEPTGSRSPSEKSGARHFVIPMVSADYHGSTMDRLPGNPFRRASFKE